MPKALFRADASQIMGHGHMMRCLTLADALRTKGWHCDFLCKLHIGHGQYQIEARGFDCYLMPVDEELDSSENTTLHSDWLGGSQSKDCAQTSELLQIGQYDLLVVDHYAIAHVWEQRCRQFVGKLAVIDDLADRPHDCDVLIDQTVGRGAEAYQGLVSASANLLVGSEYAMLRPQFSIRRAEALAKPHNKSFTRILIMMGGTDPDNATGKVLRAIGDQINQHSLKITVVLSAVAPYLEDIRLLVQDVGGELKTDIEDVASEILVHDLAVGAAGSTSWERCCLGLPSVLFTTAENQTLIASNLAAKGAVINLGKVEAQSLLDLCSLIEKFDANPHLLEPIKRSAFSICDGRGVDRVVKSLIGDGV